MMASALDPMFAYHWIDIDVEIEHNEAQTSPAQDIIKRKIEELVVKEGEALAKKPLQVGLLPKQLFHQHHSMKMFNKMTANNFLLNFSNF